MLRTNSKQAKENIKAYIMEHFDYSNYDDGENPTPESYKDVCNCIHNTMLLEKFYAKAVNEYETFKSWCRGLPSMLDTCYYYNRSAVEDLRVILEETAEEANKYTEEEAEERLTWLLYREITKNKQCSFIERQTGNRNVPLLI